MEHSTYRCCCIYVVTTIDAGNLSLLGKAYVHKAGPMGAWTGCLDAIFEIQDNLKFYLFELNLSQV